MHILITASAGNLGSALTKRLLMSNHQLRLMIHRKPLPFDISSYENVEVVHADLNIPETLSGLCEGIDCVVHFAGVLFAPRPEKFLYKTNVIYFKNLVDNAIKSGVKKIILISFPHVEGKTTPDNPARGGQDGKPDSVHAKTRLLAERYLFKACENTGTTPVILRPGMIYSRGLKMIDGGMWLLAYGLLAVWREPTHIHLISLPDFTSCEVSAVERDDVSGIYNLGDDRPLTLQELIKIVAKHKGYRKPWFIPGWAFPPVGFLVELFAYFTGLPAPITRDFIRIGRASYCSDTTRMRDELLRDLKYPTIHEGLEIL